MRSRPASLRTRPSRPRALKAAGYLSKSVPEADNYGPKTQATVAKFHDAHPTYRAAGKSYDPAIGPKGWGVPEPARLHAARHTIRTVVQTLLALTAGLPLIINAAGIPETAAGVALAVAGGITHVMALPVVENLLSA